MQGVLRVVTICFVVMAFSASACEGAWQGKPLRAATVSNGGNAACAVAGDGRVWCWGSNLYGILGNGTVAATAEAKPPTVVTGISNAIDVSVSGNEVACALLRERTVKCWGSNYWMKQLRPVEVPGLANVEAVSTGFGKVCAVIDGGQVSCFDWSKDGVLEEVEGLTDATLINSGSENVCAIRNSGQAVCWGPSNAWGQIGDGTWNEPREPVVLHNLPTDVWNLDDATSISTEDSSCAVRGNGQVLCWGYGYDGQIGNGTTEDVNPLPMLVTGINNAVEVDTGGGHSCAIRVTGAVDCWGLNSLGQLGIGTRSNSPEPVRVKGLGMAESLSVGAWSTCAVTAGEVWCWGNSEGPLGQRKDDLLRPARVRQALPATAEVKVEPSSGKVRRGSPRLLSVTFRNSGDLDASKFKVCLRVPSGVVASRCRTGYDVKSGKQRTKRFRILVKRKQPAGRWIKLTFRVTGPQIRSGSATANLLVR